MQKFSAFAATLALGASCAFAQVTHSSSTTGPDGQSATRVTSTSH